MAQEPQPPPPQLLLLHELVFVVEPQELVGAGVEAGAVSATEWSAVDEKTPAAKSAALTSAESVSDDRDPVGLELEVPAGLALTAALAGLGAGWCFAARIGRAR